MELPAKPSALTTGEMTEEEIAAIKADFRKFLYLIFLHLGLVPSALQYDVARYLQHGPRRKIICGFRGVGKTWITVAYALWVLYCDPQKKVFVVSASKAHAVSFVNFAIQLIYDIPFLRVLRPRSTQRQASDNFDVGPARPDRQPSLKAVGVTSQLPGNRGDVIIPDDVETPQTAGTVTQREKLLETIKEFAAIRKPGGIITYLGTPQTEESIYPKLEQRGYQMRIWPVEFPDQDRMAKYGARLAPYVRNIVVKDPSLVGTTVEPRFTAETLQENRIEYGRAGYALQFMLDTSLADAEKYVLRLGDLIVTGLDRTHGPHTISWGNDVALVHKELPVRGFDSDKYYRPAGVSSERAPYDLIAAFIDPSGRGADECAMTIGAGLMGRVFLFNTWGWRDGYSDTTLKDIAKQVVSYRVRKVRIESNFGDGMFAKLLKPHIDEELELFNRGKQEADKLVVGIEEERAGSAQKEKRISDILGPATQQHRVIVSTQMIEEDSIAVESRVDVAAEKRITYSWAHQFSRLTEERDCLAHDDRLEASAGLVNIFANALGINPKSAAKEKDAKSVLDEFNKLIEGSQRIAGPKAAGTEGSSGRGFRPDTRSQRRH